jgi:hypothetical protein
MASTPTTAPRVERPKHSLFDAANVIADNTSRWENGVAFTAHYCDPGRVMHGYCPPPSSADPIECRDVIEFTPVILEQTYAWDTRDLAADPKMMAVDALDVGSIRMVERALWTGKTLDPSDPTDATYEPDDIHPLFAATSLGGAVTATTALGSVLGALADSTRHVAGTGTIHMNSAVAVVLEDRLQEVDGKMTTIVGGHRVVIGDYPDNAIVGHLGYVDLYLGDIDVVEHTEHRANERIVQAQRFALAAYNACSAVRRNVNI